MVHASLAGVGWMMIMMNSVDGLRILNSNQDIVETRLHNNDQNEETEANNESSSSTFLEDTAFPSKSELTIKIKKAFKKVFGRNDPGEKCEKKKSNGETPSASNGDSPVKSFGFTKYDQDTNTTALHPGVCLSTVSSFPQPIHLEHTDFVLQGSADEIEAFFSCFEEYEILGKDIDMETGKWTDTNANVCMQVENTDEWMKTMNTSAAEILVTYTMKKIIRRLSVLKLIDSNIKEIADKISPQLKDIYEALMELNDLAKKIKDSYPTVSEVIQKTVSVVQDKNKTWKEKAKALKDFLSSQSSKNFVKNNWDGKEFVDVEKKMILTLTVHTRQSHNKRATFCTSKSQVDIAELREAFEHLVAESPLSKIISAIS